MKMYLSTAILGTIGFIGIVICLVLMKLNKAPDFVLALANFVKWIGIAILIVTAIESAYNR